METRSQQPVLEGIAALRARWTRVAFVRFGLQALFYLLLLAALVILVFPELGRAALALGLLAGAVLCGLVATWLSRPSPARLAKDFDDATGQVDRVSSSVELLGREGPMVEALHEEAARAASSIEPASVYPVTVPNEGRWMPVPVVLVVAALLLPGFFAEQAKTDPEFEASLEQRIEQLEELLSREKNKELTPLRKELLLELEELKAELDGEKVDRKDTMAEVAKLLEQLQNERDEESKKLQELEKMLKGLQEKTGQESLNQMLQQGQYQEALKKLREEIEELKKKLEEMKKDGASEEELADLEELLKKLEEIEAKMVAMLQIDIDLSMLGEAIDFLADWDGELGDLADLEDFEMVEPGEP